MKYTLKCPKCQNVFTFSEENDNYAFCECGWEFQLSEHFDDFEEVCLNGEDETFDVIWQKIDNQVSEMKPKSGRTWVQDGMRKAVNEYLKYLKYLKESKFTSIPKEELNSLENFIKQIDLRKVRIFRKDHASETKIGVIKISGIDINVYMGNYAEPQYQKNRNAIVIPYGDDLDKPHILDRIRYNVRHEIGHILDMKVLQPEFTAKDNEKYKELLNKPVLTDVEKIRYSKFPVEVDAVGTEFDSIIKDNFTNADYESKLKIIEEIKKWIKYGGDNLPFFQPEVVRAWRTKPTLYRKFQKKVYNLVQDLEKLLKGKENGNLS